MTANGSGMAVESLCQQLQRNGSSQGFGIDIVGQGFIDCKSTFAKLLTIGITERGIQMESLGAGRLCTDLLHDPPPHLWTACRLQSSKICANNRQSVSARHGK